MNMYLCTYATLCTDKRSIIYVHIWSLRKSSTPAVRLTSNFRTTIEPFKFRSEAKSPPKSPHLGGNTRDDSVDDKTYITSNRSEI